MACQIFDQLFGFRRNDQFPNKRNEGKWKMWKKCWFCFNWKWLTLARLRLWHKFSHFRVWYLFLPTHFLLTFTNLIIMNDVFMRKRLFRIKSKLKLRFSTQTLRMKYETFGLKFRPRTPLLIPSPCFFLTGHKLVIRLSVWFLPSLWV